MTDPRRDLPAVNTLLEEAERRGLLNEIPRGLVVGAIRSVLEQARKEGGCEPSDGWYEAVSNLAARRRRSTLFKVVNATGVVLHTNLGRAPLARAAYDAASRAFEYSTLELDLDSGTRGSRQTGLEELLIEVTGAEAGLVVTNAAAALFLVLNTVAGGGETVVSRGELVEIGGSFRIPEILARSGSVLVEVGTTNRTRLRDYTLALSPRTRAFLKVHRSNFALVGFTEETSLEELIAAGASRDIPTINDIGSGLLVDLSEYGLRGEPLVSHSVEAGATTVFSGDKLVGGPQAGIIVGPKEVLAKAKSNPLARALRPDKFTIAALEATLSLYRDADTAISEIPALAMLVAETSVLEDRAKTLCMRLPGAQIIPGGSAVGGGAFPGKLLPSTLVAISSESPDTLLSELRQHDPPVIARVVDGDVVFDVRTISDEEFDIVESAVRTARSR